MRNTTPMAGNGMNEGVSPKNSQNSSFGLQHALNVLSELINGYNKKSAKIISHNLAEELVARFPKYLEITQGSYRGIPISISGLNSSYLTFNPQYGPNEDGGIPTLTEENPDIFLLMDIYKMPYRTHYQAQIDKLHDTVASDYRFHSAQKFRLQLSSLFSDGLKLETLQKLLAEFPQYLSVVENNTQLRMDFTHFKGGDISGRSSHDFIVKIAQTLHLIDQPTSEQSAVIDHDIASMESKVGLLTAQVHNVRSGIQSDILSTNKLSGGLSESVSKKIQEALNEEIESRMVAHPQNVLLTQEMGLLKQKIKEKTRVLEVNSRKREYGLYMEQVGNLIQDVPSELHGMIQGFHYRALSRKPIADERMFDRDGKLRSYGDVPFTPMHGNSYVLQDYLKGDIDKPFGEINRFKRVLQILKRDGKFDNGSFPIYGNGGVGDHE